VKYIGSSSLAWYLPGILSQFPDCAPKGMTCRSVGESDRLEELHFATDTVLPCSLLVLCWLLGCSADHLQSKGDSALDAHDLPSAETSFRAALEKDPSHLPALVGLGWTYHLAGEREAAVASFDRCLQIEPGRGDCLRGKASIALANGDRNLARQLIDEALLKYPDDPLVESSAALIDLSDGNIYAAEERYRSLALRFPDRAEYLLGLGESLFRKDEAQEAVRIAEQALQIKGTPLRYQAMLWALRARGILRASARLEDPARCEETFPPVLAWVEAAEESVRTAEETGVKMPELPALRRLVLRRKAILFEACPSSGTQASGN
jgi:tetratricopeptide (TPR) repeat protein